MPPKFSVRNPEPSLLTTCVCFHDSPERKVIEEDPETMEIVRRTERTWILDVATGEQTEVQTPVGSWQRLAP